MAVRFTEKDAAIIKARIDAAKSIRTEWLSTEGDPDMSGFSTRPEFWLSVINGTYWRVRSLSQSVPGRTRALIRTSNQILPKLRVKQDILTQGETVFMTEARQQRFMKEAMDVGAALSSEWDVLGFDRECNKARWDSDIYSYGVVEMGWVFENEETGTIYGKRGDPQVPLDAEPLIGGANFDRQTDPEAQPREFEDADEAAAYFEWQEKAYWGHPTKDDPYVERFNPTELLVDPQCRNYDLSDARYAVREKLEWLTKVKGNPFYKNTKDLKGTHTVGEKQSDLTERSRFSTDVEAARDDSRLVVLYDGWYKYDVNHDGKDEILHVIMCDEHDKPLLVQEGPYEWPDGCPFPFVVCPGPVDDNDNFYQEPPISHVCGRQLAYDEAMRQLDNRRAKSNRMFKTSKGVLDHKAQAALEAGRDGTVIELTGRQDMDALQPLESAMIQPEVYATLKEVPDEIARMLGVSQFQEAVTPQKKMLATEVNALTEQGGARQGGDAERFRIFKERVALRVLGLLQQFSESPRPYSYMDDMGNKKYAMLGADQLRGNAPVAGETEAVEIQWRVKLDAENAKGRSKSVERAEKTQLLAGLQPFMAMPDPSNPMMPLVNPKPLLRHVLRAYDIPDADDVVSVNPTGTPVPQPGMPGMPGSPGLGLPVVAPGMMPQAPGPTPPQPQAPMGPQPPAAGANPAGVPNPAQPSQIIQQMLAAAQGRGGNIS